MEVIAIKPRELIEFLNIIEKNKCNTRHSWTSTGRHESVAEHSWRSAVMALLIADELPEIDINKVVKMCLIHDFGEAITGDIPSFLKTDKDESAEASAIAGLLELLSDDLGNGFKSLFEEMSLQITPEAKLFKAIDNLEALISHNEAQLNTWLPNEYELNKTYALDTTAFSVYTKALREEVLNDTLEKIKK